MINTKEIQKGDFFSETTYYQSVDLGDGKIVFKVLGSDQTVEIDNEYIEQNFASSDIYDEEIMVGKEDKKDGTLGIRSIFENFGNQICTVAFFKQDKPKTKKAYNDELKAQAKEAADLIEKARNSKKSMLDVAVKEIAKIQQNPVLPYTPGELRIMTGYKLAFNSRDGRYSFMDVEINEQRPVNINTIVAFIGGGKKYYLRGHKNSL